MKRITKMILALTVLFMSNNMMAQETVSVRKAEGEKKQSELTVEERAQKRTDQMKKELSLDSSQETKIYSINLAHIAEMDKLRAEQKALKEKVKAERENTRTKIKAVLTPDQIVIFDQKAEEHKKKQDERRTQHHD